MNINVPNVSTLIHFMESLDGQGFNMRAFVHNCGSPSCALGWASTIPALQEAGMRPITNSDKYRDIRNMGESVFGDVYSNLFSTCGEAGECLTPKGWALVARDFLSRHGHKVAPIITVQADHFRTFMARVLAPRPELQGLPLELPQF